MTKRVDPDLAWIDRGLEERSISYELSQAESEAREAEDALRYSDYMDTTFDHLSLKVERLIDRRLVLEKKILRVLPSPEEKGEATQMYLELQELQEDLLDDVRRSVRFPQAALVDGEGVVREVQVVLSPKARLKALNAEADMLRRLSNHAAVYEYNRRRQLKEK